MARPKQTKQYKKERLKVAKELLLSEFGPGSFKELRKKYAIYQGKSDKQSEIILFLLEKKYNFSEIGKLAGKSHEAIRKVANKAMEELGKNKEEQVMEAPTEQHEKEFVIPIKQEAKEPIIEKKEEVSEIKNFSPVNIFHFDSGFAFDEEEEEEESRADEYREKIVSEKFGKEEINEGEKDFSEDFSIGNDEFVFDSSDSSDYEVVSQEEKIVEEKPAASDLELLQDEEPGEKPVIVPLSPHKVPSEIKNSFLSFAEIEKNKKIDSQLKPLKNSNFSEEHKLLHVSKLFPESGEVGLEEEGFSGYQNLSVRRRVSKRVLQGMSALLIFSLFAYGMLAFNALLNNRGETSKISEKEKNGSVNDNIGSSKISSGDNFGQNSRFGSSSGKSSDSSNTTGETKEKNKQVAVNSLKPIESTFKNGKYQVSLNEKPCRDGEYYIWNKGKNKWSCETTKKINGTLFGDTTPGEGNLLIGSGYDFHSVPLGGDILIRQDGIAIVQPDSVALGNDTTGNYVEDIFNGSGIQGATQGEKTRVTLELGPLTKDWDQTGSADIVLNNKDSRLKMLESDGDTYYGTLSIGDLNQSATYTFSGASGTLLTTANYTETLDPAYVNVSGDTMTGSLFLPENGLSVGGNQLTVVDGKIGIGTAAPGSKLSVKGNASFGSNYAGSIAPENGIIIEGNVGIGTASPTDRLEVVGNASFSEGYFQVDSPTTISLDADSSVSIGGETMSLITDGGQLKIQSSANLDIDAGTNITIDGVNFTLTPTGTTNIDSTGSVTIDSDSSITLGGAGVNISSDGGELDLTGNANIDINAGLDLTVDGRHFTLTPTGNYSVNAGGNIGMSTLTGGVTLAGVSMNLNVNGGIITAGGNIVPASDLAYNLGSGALRWNEMYAGHLYVGGSTTTGQAIFTYEPLSTLISQSSVYINPSSVIENAPLFGVAVNGSERFRVDEDGDITVQGLITGNAGAIVTGGIVNLNASSNFATNINTGTSTGTVAIGGGLNLISIDSSDWDISSTGSLSGISGIANDGAYTQTGVSANTFTGTATFSNATYSALFTGGNVGIGTTSPSAKLDVVSGAYYRQLMLSDSKIDSTSRRVGIVAPHYVTGEQDLGLMTLYADSDSTEIGIGGGGGITGDLNVATNIKFYTAEDTITVNPSPRMTITNTGNVGINTNGPDRKLDILDASNPQLRLTYTDSSIYTDFKVDASGNLYITKNGTSSMSFVGTGISSPGYGVYGGTTPLNSGLRLPTSGEIRWTNTGTSDDSVGLSKPTSGILKVTNGSTGYGTLIAGNIGIGTTSPTYQLDVTGTGRFTGALTVGGALTVTGDLLPSANDTYNLGSDTMRWANAWLGAETLHIGTADADEGEIGYDTTNNVMTVQSNGNLALQAGGGNVGIGTTAPATKLDITNISAGNVTFPLQLTNVGGSNDGSGVGIQFSPFDTGATPLAQIYSYRKGSNDYPLVFKGWGGSLAEYMRIATGGNVGIGTTAPNTKLEVSSGSIRLADTYNLQWGGTTNYISGSNASNYLALTTNNTEALRINSSGNVGIGTTNPTNKLSVNGKIAFSDSANVSLHADNGNLDFLTYSGNGTVTVTAYDSRHIILTTSQGGNVGIGTTSPGASLDITQYGYTYGYPQYKSFLNIKNHNWGIPLATNIDFYLGTGNYATIQSGYIRSVSEQTWSTVASTQDSSMMFGVALDGNINEALRISSSGNVGIGTTDPTYKLDVSGTGRFTGALTVGGALTVAGDLLPSANDTYSLGSDTMRWANAWLGAETIHVGTADADEGEIGYDTTNNVMTVQSNGNLALQAGGGNVGIGTTNPGTKLSVSGSTYLNGSVTVNATINAFGIGTTGLASDFGVYSYGGYNIKFATSGGSEHMRINSSGNVGIGTTSPSTFKLEVAGSVGPSTDNLYDLGTSGRRWANVYANTVTATNLVGSIVPTGFTQGPVVFGASGGALAQDNDLFWDNNNKRLGIGTTAPGQKLDVVGKVKIGDGTNFTTIGQGLAYAPPTQQEIFDIQYPSNGGVRFWSNLNNYDGAMFQGFGGTSALLPGQMYFDYGSGARTIAGRQAVWRNMNNGNSFTTVLTLDASSNVIVNSGNVGIGTTNPSEKLEVSGNAKLSGDLAVNGGDITSTTTLTINPTGNLYFQSSSFYINESGQLTVATDETINGIDINAGAISDVTSLTVDNIIIDGTTIGHTSDTDLLNLASGILTINGTADINGAIDQDVSVADYASNIYNSNATTGGGLYVRSDGTGNLLTLNNNGTDIVTITPTQTTFNNPVAMTSAGDVSINYDLYFNNPTASYIKFQGPGYIQTESPYANLDLTLSAANSGNVIISDTALFQNTTNAVNAYQFLNASGTSVMSVDTTNGRVGIGTTAPTYTLDVSGTGRFTGALTVGGALTVTGDLLPSANDTYSLGSDTMRWANAWLGAETIHVGTADADEGEIGYTTSTNVMTVQSNGNLALQASSGNVGIGTTNPGGILEVTSLGASRGLVFGYHSLYQKYGSDGLYIQTQAGGGNTIFNTQSGNVGIGTTAPTYKLDVYGTIAGHSELILGGIEHGAGMGYGLISGKDSSGNTQFRVTASGNYGSNSYFNANGGNVGIGTTDPTYKLDVSGTGRFTGALTVGGALTTTGDLLPSANDTYSLGSDSMRWANAWLGAETIHVGTADADEGEIGYDTTNNVMTVQSNGNLALQAGGGNVGIGTTNPTSLLTVQGNIGFNSGVGAFIGLTNQGGDISSNDLTLTAANATNSVVVRSAATFQAWTYSGGQYNERFRVAQNGNVGIGTTGPNQKLQIYHSTAPIISLTAGGSNPAISGAVDFLERDSSGAGFGTADAFGFRIVNDGSSGVDSLKIKGGEGTTVTDIVTINRTSGNVGIGTTGPLAKLDVNGNLAFGPTNGRQSFYSDFYSVPTTTQVNIVLRDGVTNLASGWNYKIKLVTTGTATSSGAEYIISQDASGVWTSKLVSAKGYTANHPLLGISGNNVFVYHNHASTYSINTFVEGYYTANVTTTAADFFGLGASITSLTGNVGIGTTNPTYKLDVTGTGRFTGALTVGGALTVTGDLLPSANDTYSLGSDTMRWANAWLGAETIHVGTADADEGEIGYTTATNVMTVQSNGNLALQASSGNVGIGTTNPGYKLDVSGSGNFSGSLRATGGLTHAALGMNRSELGMLTYSGAIPAVLLEMSGYDPWYMSAGNNVAWSIPGYGMMNLERQSGGNGAALNLFANNVKYISLSTWNSVNSYISVPGGNLGIGTTDPSNFKLQVAGSIGPNADNTYNLGSGSYRFANAYATNIYGAINPTGFTQGSVVYAGTSGVLSQDNSSFFYDAGNHRLGIGTTSPDRKLDVLDASNPQIRLTHTDGSVYADMQTDSNGRLNISTSGGTSTGNVAVTGNLSLQASYGDYNEGIRLIKNPGGYLGITFANSNTSGSSGTEFSISRVNSSLNGYAVDDYAIYNFGWSGGALPQNNQMIWFDRSSGNTLFGGNVGIGTTAPEAKLHVVGSTGSTGYATLVNNNSFYSSESSTGTNIRLMGMNGLNSVYLGAIDDAGGDVRIREDGNDIITISSGNVGIGTTNPGYKLDVQGSSTSYLSQLYNSNATTGGGLYVRSDGTGNLLTLNNNGTDIVTITPTQTTFNNPVAMTSAGDVSINYDLYFNNPTASYIKFQGPGYIQTESSYQNLNLYLSAANAGEVIVDDNLQVAGTSIFKNTTNAVNAYQFLNSSGTSVMNVDTTNGRVGIGTTNPGADLDIYNSGTYSTLRFAGPGGNSSIYRNNGSNGSIQTAVGSEYLFSVGGSAETYAFRNSGVSTNMVFSVMGGGYNRRLVVLEGGNVGIGTTAPTYTLDVTGTGRFTGALTVGGALTTTGDLLPSANDTYNLGSDTMRWANAWLGAETIHVGTADADEGEIGYTTSTNVMTVQSNGNLALQSGGGNVGIGTTAPGAKLEVANGNILLSSATNLMWGTGANGYIQGNVASNYLALGTNNNERIRIDSSGNVGIGTTAPTSNLHVYSSSNTLLTVDSPVGTYAQLSFATSGTNNWILRRPPSSTDLRFYDGSNDRITFQNGGNVGIGTTAPWQKLHVEGNIYLGTGSKTIYGSGQTGPNINFNDGTGSMSAQFTTGAFDVRDSTGTPRLYVKSGGNVGIGTTNPSYNLDVQGSSTSYLSQLYNSNATTGGGLYVRSDGTGNLLTLNNNGTDIVTITPTQTTFNNPVAMTSAGDVSMNYDLYFNNPTSSYIKFKGAGYIQTESPYQNLNLYLQGANLGKVVLDDDSEIRGSLLVQNTTNAVNAYQFLNASGTSVMSVDTTNGRVGIGVTNPSESLHIKGGAIAIQDMYGNPYTTIGMPGGIDDLVFSTSYGGTDFIFKTGSATERMRIRYNGYVGIGNSSPSYTLDVTGTGRFTGALTVGGSGSFTNINPYDATYKTTSFFNFYPGVDDARFFHAGTSWGDPGIYVNGSTVDSLWAGSIANSLAIRGDGSGGISFYNYSSAPSMVLRYGNVGIGTTSPSTFKLEVAGSVGPSTDNLYDLGTSGRRWANVYANTVTATNLAGSIVPTGFTQGPVVFGASGGALAQDNDLFWDNNNKRLGIGTTAPVYKLQVAGGSNGNTQLGLTGASTYLTFSPTANYYEIAEYTVGKGLAFSVSGVQAAMFTQSTTGNVGIGTTNPSEKLEVSGNAKLSGDLAVNGGDITSTTTLTINPTGNLYFQSSSFYINESGQLTVATDETINGIDINAGAISDVTSLTVDNIIIDGTTIGHTSDTDLLNLASGILTINGTADINGAVDQDVSVADYASNIYNSNATTGGGLYVRSDGTGNLLTLNNVGTDIVTITPTQTTFNNPVAMTSAGDVSMNYDLYFNNPTSSFIKFQGNGYIQTESPTDNLNLYLSAANSGRVSVSDQLTVQNTTNSVDAYQFLNASGTSVMSVDTTNGRVGIGVTNPDGKFNVALPADTNNTFLKSSAGDNLLRVQTFVTTNRMQLLAGLQNGGGTPQYSFLNDTDTGMSNVQETANTLNFVTGGTEKVRITSGGNVGIGTTNPTYKLDVTGTGRFTGALTVGGALTTTGDLLPSANDTYSLGSDTMRWANAWLGAETIHVGTADADEGEIGYTTSTNVMTIQSNGNLALQSGGGNVGIGTTNPIYSIDVQGSNGAAIASLENAGINTYLRFKGTNRTMRMGVEGARDFVVYSDTSSSYRMIIDSSGNVGINATGPDRKLDVLDASNPQIRLTHTDGTVYTDLQTTSAGNLYINPSGGNVGIGTTAPGGKLHVSGGQIVLDNAAGVSNYDNGGTLRPTLYYSSANNTQLSNLASSGSIQLINGNDSGQITLYTGASILPRLTVNQAGNVGIGTTNPGYKLDVQGSSTSYLSQLYNSNATTGGGLYVRSDGTGNLLTLNNAGTDIVTITPTQTTFNNPVAMTSAGDVSINYDLYFNNPTASYIKFQGPGYIQTESPSENYNLYLQAANSGNVVVLDTSVFQNSSNAVNAYQFNNASGTSVMSVDTTNGRVGIGVTNPGEKLDLATGYVKGRGIKSDSGSALNMISSGTTSSISFLLNTSDARTAGQLLSLQNNATPMFYVNDTGATTMSGTLTVSGTGNTTIAGNVGIGITNPSQKLHVYSPSTETRIVVDGPSGQYRGLNFSTNNSLRWFLSGASSLAEGGGNAGSDFSLFRYDDTGTFLGNAVSVTRSTGDFNFNSNDVYFQNSTGNVGIGTTNPQAALDLGNSTGGKSIVWGGATGANMYAAIGTSHGSADLNSLSGLKLATGSDLVQYSYTGTYAPSGIRLDFSAGDILFFNQASGSKTAGDTFDYTANTKLTVKASGNVGIGTTNPGALLDIGGDARTYNGRFFSINSATGNTIELKAYNNYGEIKGVGTPYHIVLTPGGTGNVGINTTAPTRKLESLDASNPQMRLTYTTASVYTDLQTTSTGNFYIAPSGTGVGIGVADPAGYKLNVAGTGYFGGAVTTTDDLILSSATAELKIMESAGATYYGTIEIGDLSADATYTLAGPSGNILTSTTEPILTSGGRHTRKIQLNAEYMGAVLSKFYGAGTDTSTTGTMSSDAEPSADLLRTFYNWSSSEASLNYYTVAIRVTLPSDFDSWATSNAVQVDLDTKTATVTDNSVDIYIYNSDDTPGTAVVSSTGNKSASADVWATASIDDSVVDDGSAPEWDGAGETAVIYLRLGAKDSNFARVGDIKLNYLSKW